MFCMLKVFSHNRHLLGVAAGDIRSRSSSELGLQILEKTNKTTKKPCVNSFKVHKERISLEDERGVALGDQREADKGLDVEELVDDEHDKIIW